MDEFYATPRLYEAPPIEGALEGVKALKDIGYRLVLVTARQVRELPRTKEWVDKYYKGIFDDIICTGMSQETLADESLLVTKLSKADVSLPDAPHALSRLIYYCRARSARSSAQSS